MLASVGLLVFGLWCVGLIRDVTRLRTEVAERVHWMQVARRVQTGASAGPDPAFDQAVSALDAEVPALQAASRQDPVLAAAVEQLLAGLHAVEHEHAPAVIRDALDPLVPALRAQTAVRSVELGRLWDSLYALVAVALLLALTTLASFVYARFVWMARTRDDMARLQSMLLRADRLAALGTLAATVAHEINNPLSYVLTNLDLLRDRIDRDPLRTPAGDDLTLWIGDAEDGARRVAKIVKDLRNFSHPGYSDARVSVDVHAALDAAVRITEGEARGRTRIRCEYGKAPLVSANEAQLGQVFLNLLVNAVQAIEPGAPQDNEIVIRTRSVREEVLIEICDSGSGIAPEDVGRMFEPFVTTKQAGEGTGLGLYVCRSIVESLGGSISLSPIVGGGTRAAVRLPRSLPTCESGEHSIAVHEPTPTEDRQLKVLIIDDEALLASALARSLRGHEVHTANCGADGRWARCPPRVTTKAPCDGCGPRSN